MMMNGPFFSMLVTTYNRAQQVERCVRSCGQQTFQDFEIVVVDDASTDRTAQVLATLDEPRLRAVRHEQNRGISPARATAVRQARGNWFVIVDSDWELFPHTLARLRTLIDALPPGVRTIRSRLQMDDGSICPPIMPTGITDYRERLRWMEAVSAEGTPSDTGHCIHRSVFEKNNYFERRGGVEVLWELNLARRESTLWVPDILGREHTDAPNSHSRDASASRLISRVLGDAPDGLWMTETLLAEHGAELARYAPRGRRWVEERAALYAFLAGDRRAGIRHTRAAIRTGPVGWKLWATLVIGMLGPRALAYAKLAGRQWRAAARELVGTA
jgi:glycosyltransferase involved in cell wall biosynthesis